MRMLLLKHFWETGFLIIRQANEEFSQRVMGISLHCDDTSCVTLSTTKSSRICFVPFGRIGSRASSAVQEQQLSTFPLHFSVPFRRMAAPPVIDEVSLPVMSLRVVLLSSH